MTDPTLDTALRRYASARDPEAAFHAHLDEYPDDHDSRKVFADWLEERGDPRGEALRWLAERGKWPSRQLRNADLQPVWRWNRRWADEKIGGPWDFHFSVPIPPHRLIRGIWGNHSSRREAEDQFAAAFQEAKATGWDPHGS